MLSPGLLVVHDAGGGGQDDETELTRRKELDDPLLHVAELDVVAGRDDTSLVEAGAMSVAVLTRQRKLVDCDTYRPFSWMTILPLRWSSTSSNSPM